MEKLRDWTKLMEKSGDGIRTQFLCFQRLGLETSHRTVCGWFVTGSLTEQIWMEILPHTGHWRSCIKKAEQPLSPWDII